MSELNLNYRFSVAPMMGVTTSSARYMYRLISKEAILFTEMIASQALHRGDYRKLLRKQEIESPVVLQVGGSDINLLKYTTALANKFNYQGINLNVGCPSKKVSQGKMGACLMKEAELVRDCLNSMKVESSIDVSLKCRIGVDEFDSYEFFREFISTVLESDIKIIFQPIENLHRACPNSKGDWYFTGVYPTDGGNRVVNTAFVNFYEGNKKRAY